MHFPASENEKGLYLAVALRGQAQGILVDLPIDKQQDYKSLVKALEERFAPTASRIASFKFWGRDCLKRILISASARASIKCCFASVSRTFSGTVG
jgi:hypothetical protein